MFFSNVFGGRGGGINPCVVPSPMMMMIIVIIVHDILCSEKKKCIICQNNLCCVAFSLEDLREAGLDVRPKSRPNIHQDFKQCKGVSNPRLICVLKFKSNID